MDDQSIAVYALTKQGLAVAERVCAALPRAEMYLPESLRGQEIPRPCPGLRPPTLPKVHWFKRLGEAVAAGFSEYKGHVFVTAAGIAVRVTAPYLQGKTRDPAVLVLDQRGRYVISLLSGHVGGANALAVHIAGKIGAEPVITTASDVEELARQ